MQTEEGRSASSANGAAEEDVDMMESSRIQPSASPSATPSVADEEDKSDDNDDEEEEDDDNEEDMTDDSSENEGEEAEESDAYVYRGIPLQAIKYFLRRGGCEPADETAVKVAALLTSELGETVLETALHDIVPHAVADQRKTLTRDVVMEAMASLGLSIPKPPYHVDADL